MNHTFTDLGVHASLVASLTKKGITQPSPIQAQAIPVALTGADIIGIAQTGTGKTFAFGLPMLERLAKHKGQGLVLLPTRELAIQVDESLRMVGASMGLKTACLIGGAPMGMQIKALKAKPHVIIATPGRLNDHLMQKTIQLNNIKILVLDEADRMLDMGFAPQLDKIFATLPRERQTMLFSATMPLDIVQMAAGHMKQPTRIEIAPEGTAAERVTQEIIFTARAKKNELLDKVLSENEGTTLVFTRTKHGAKNLCQSLNTKGHRAAEIHANRTLGQRRAALEGFKNGKFRILVATDIAARGIDVKGINLVVNFDLPDAAADYVHRIGRTGRAGQEGKAISFACPDQKHDVRDIERLMKKKIPVSGEVPAEASSAPRNSYPRKSFGGNRRFAQNNYRNAPKYYGK
jgi:ATP-dependent RNA helicase RhlE